MTMVSLFLKRFAGWVTASTDSYRYNPFVRATVNVILLQVILIALTVGMFWWALGYSQNRTVDSISSHIEEVTDGFPATATQSLPESIDDVRARTLTYAFVGILALSAIFGFLLARFALWPARNSLQFQKRFIGNVAHEIRTPLAIIKTNTEVALMDPKVPPDIREVFNDTIVELDRMSETINNLLTFDTLVRPGSMKTVPVDVRSLVQTVAERHTGLAESRGVGLTITATEAVTVNGNVTALEQVVTNLVKNAINYTPKDQGKVVEVSAAEDVNGRVVITVADSGIGIAQRDLYHIFEPFYRADTSRARGIGTGSSGLGLAIVNEIVRAHHGSISIRSVLGQGTTIKVSLPRTNVSTYVDTGASDDDTTGEVSVDFSRKS